MSKKPAVAAPVPARQIDAALLDRARRQASAPVAALLRHRQLGQGTFLDYGCGDGADVKLLQAAGVAAAGWDPQTCPNAPKLPADAVSLGYVLNAIEDPALRRRCLSAAWELTKRVLAVAVPLAGHTPFLRARQEHADSEVFDRHFSPQELHTLVEGMTGRQAVWVGAGVVLVFRRDEDEQACLRARATQHSPEPLSKADWLAYLALQVFERRRSFAALPAATEQALAGLFGSVDEAMNEARIVLFSASNPDVVAAAAEQAAAERLAHLEHNDGLFFAARRLPQLPPVLRVLVGCAEHLYGDACACHVIKVHDRSGKLTFHLYDDFWGQPVPKLLERTKVDLRRQRIDYFAYDHQPHAPQPLYFKSKWMVEGDLHLDDQRAFDAELAAVDGIDWTGYGPETDELAVYLKKRGLQIRGFALEPA